MVAMSVGHPQGYTAPGHPIHNTAAEEHVLQLVRQIQPNRRSEERRTAIISHVHGLIERCFTSCKVFAFAFGSVPLKTYLPDGDIDLSLFQAAGPSVQPDWTDRLAATLEAEAASKHGPHRVHNVQIINAEVNLVKCLVDDTVVDISFQTLGGLCTVLFLESIDQHIQADHLFKRSIILVKAWCYYESRLLGAHHGLISTYALEVLVLYVFNYHRETCTTPLQVLATFLRVFSSFDWDHACVTLQGPVPMTMLSPDFVPPPVEPPPPSEEDTPPTRNDAPAGGGSSASSPEQTGARVSPVPPPVPPSQQPSLDPMLLEGLRLQFSQEALGIAPHGRQFQAKHLNILDPLLASNNLGRSVSKSSFSRIRKALAHGAKTLDAILASTSSDQQTIRSLDSFFRNTWRAVQQRAATTDAPRTSGGVPQPPTPMPPLLQQHAEFIAQLMSTPTDQGVTEQGVRVATVRPGVGLLQDEKTPGSVTDVGLPSALPRGGDGGDGGSSSGNPQGAGGGHSRGEHVEDGHVGESRGDVQGTRQHRRTPSLESTATASARIPPATRDQEASSPPIPSTTPILPPLGPHPSTPHPPTTLPPAMMMMMMTHPHHTWGPLLNQPMQQYDLLAGNLLLLRYHLSLALQCQTGPLLELISGYGYPLGRGGGGGGGTKWSTGGGARGGSGQHGARGGRNTQMDMLRGGVSTVPNSPGGRVMLYGSGRNVTSGGGGGGFVVQPPPRTHSATHLDRHAQWGIMEGGAPRTGGGGGNNNSNPMYGGRPASSQAHHHQQQHQQRMAASVPTSPRLPFSEPTAYEAHQYLLQGGGGAAPIHHPPSMQQHHHGNASYRAMHTSNGSGVYPQPYSQQHHGPPPSSRSHSRPHSRASSGSRPRSPSPEPRRTFARAAAMSVLPVGEERMMMMRPWVARSAGMPGYVDATPGVDGTYGGGFRGGSLEAGVGRRPGGGRMGAEKRGDRARPPRSDAGSMTGGAVAGMPPREDAGGGSALVGSPGADAMASSPATPQSPSFVLADEDFPVLGGLGTPVAKQTSPGGWAARVGTPGANKSPVKSD